jgi:hypothetical protein
LFIGLEGPADPFFKLQANASEPIARSIGPPGNLFPLHVLGDFADRFPWNTSHLFTNPDARSLSERSAPIENLETVVFGI